MSNEKPAPINSSVETNIALSRAVLMLAFLNTELKQQALTDPLTGLPNRRAFKDEFTRVLSHQKRSGRTGSVLFVDLDRFKQVNDTHGHQTGDTLLSKAAKAIQTHIRTDDYAARIGGEEFAVLLPETAEAGAINLADNLRTYITSAHPLGVTASVGVSSLTADSVTENLMRADQAMYWAKRLGRDQVVVWSPELPPMPSSTSSVS